MFAASWANTDWCSSVLAQNKLVSEGDAKHPVICKFADKPQYGTFNVWGSRTCGSCDQTEESRILSQRHHKGTDLVLFSDPVTSQSSAKTLCSPPSSSSSCRSRWGQRCEPWWDTDSLWTTLVFTNVKTRDCSFFPRAGASVALGSRDASHLVFV